MFAQSAAPFPKTMYHIGQCCALSKKAPTINFNHLQKPLTARGKKKDDFTARMLVIVQQTEENKGSLTYAKFHCVCILFSVRHLI